MNPLVKLAASALPGEKRYVLLAGAGVSKDAGIPTAWDLMLKTASLLYAGEVDNIDSRPDLERWFETSSYAQSTYAELMEQLYPNPVEQQAFLSQFLGGQNIGDAHRGIGELARRGIVRAIVTTNFDNSIERALEEAGAQVQVISSEDDVKTCEPLIHCKCTRVYKPHGTLGKGTLKNTPKDLEALSPGFEAELYRLFSEHGVIVLGYSGRDPGMRRVLSGRTNRFFPLFWVDPTEPTDEVREALGEQSYTYIPCRGASDFIRSFLALIDRIASLAPEVGSGPTLVDLEQAVKAESKTVASLFEQFMANLHREVEETRPDFSAFSDVDEAIMHQIGLGLPIVNKLLDVAEIAITNEAATGLESIYHGFGRLLTLYRPPDDSRGSFSELEFDGFKFLVYEMFVGFIALLVKHEQWEFVGSLLSQDLFLESESRSGYSPFNRIDAYVRTLDVMRNTRLNLRRISVMSDVLKDRFNDRVDCPIGHKDFMAGDYFLFIRTACQETSGMLSHTWCPRASIWLTSAPRFIKKCESQRFTDRFVVAVGMNDAAEFVEVLKERRGLFAKFFPDKWGDDPLDDVDLDKMLSRP